MVTSRRDALSHGALMQPRSIIPIVAGCIMLCASVLPWLSDPLGEKYTAWTLSIDVGWQFRSPFVNYGLLCLFCSIYAFMVALANWRPFKGCHFFARKYTTAGLLCALPTGLFFLQYLCSDLPAINRLAQHEIQLLLVQNYFGYHTAPQSIPLEPFTVDISTLQGRLELLIDHLSVGVLLPLLSAWLLIDHRRFFKTPDTHPARTRSGHRWLAGIIILAGGILLARAPAALFCEYQAKMCLASGENSAALEWFGVASFLNPSLNQTAFFHLERGQALHYLHPEQQSNDSRAYTAFTYRSQGAYADAYQLLLVVSQSQPNVAWVGDEMSLTLEKQVEAANPLGGQPATRLDHDELALQWLQALTHIDPQNIYGQYLTGRIQYDLHNYVAGIEQMSIVLNSSSNPDVQSSAYTYMALGYAGQGDYIRERALLLKALQLDPSFRNNTAREQLSGLH